MRKYYLIGRDNNVIIQCTCRTIAHVSILLTPDVFLNYCKADLLVVLTYRRINRLQFRYSVLWAAEPLAKHKHLTISYNSEANSLNNANYLSNAHYVNSSRTQTYQELVYLILWQSADLIRRRETSNLSHRLHTHKYKDVKNNQSIPTHAHYT